MDFIKVNCHVDDQHLHFYMKYDNTFEGLMAELVHLLFVKRKLKPFDVRIYWIDGESDEIEILDSDDYMIFKSKFASAPSLPPLHVRPVRQEEDDTKKTTTTANGNIPSQSQNDTDPSNFVIHERVECDHCQVAPIVGFRYKCIQCPNFDLCQRCEAAHVHPDHMMVRMPHENCPTVVEAWISGRSGRRGSKRSSKSHCPFVFAPGECGMFANLDESQTSSGAGCKATSSGSSPQAKESTTDQRGDHHHRRHARLQRRQLRNGIFGHLYNMMHDLAEGSGATPFDDPENNATADKNAKKPETAEEAAIRKAEAAACNAEKVATEVAGVAAAVAASAAAAADCYLTSPLPTAPPPPPPPYEPEQKPSKAAPSTSSAPAASPDSTSASQTETSTAEPKPEAKNSNPGTPPLNLNSPTLENLAQLIDPQYMKAGIEILNNFSEMFAKMLEPADGGSEMACPFSGQASRMSSANSSMSTSGVSTASTKATVNEPQTPKASDEKIRSEETEKKDNKSEEGKNEKDITDNAASAVLSSIIASEAPKALIAAAAGVKDDSAERDSFDCDWQLVDGTVVPQDAIGLTPPAVAEATQDKADDDDALNLTTANHVLNYAQLSRQLRAHIEQEAKDQQQQQPKQDKHAQTEVTVATATAATTTSPIPEEVATGVEERRAVPVYHHDERINTAVNAMMSMGFSNEGAWLTQLLESVNGNIAEALDLMSVAQGKAQ